MMKLGIRAGKAHTPLETAASPGVGSGGHLPEQELGQAPAPENVVVPVAGEPYRPRHAADAVEGQLHTSEFSTELGRGRHQR
jgi:hypothetical protein